MPFDNPKNITPDCDLSITCTMLALRVNTIKSCFMIPTQLNSVLQIAHLWLGYCDNVVQYYCVVVAQFS